MNAPAKAPAHARIIVLGASTNPDRYSYKAVHDLKANGFVPVPVHPSGKEVLGFSCSKELSQVDVSAGKIHTVSVYVGPDISTPMEKDILALKPARVIFNPGAENTTLGEHLEKHGIAVEEACTLVLLGTKQF